MSISYTDSIKCLGYIFSSNNSDGGEMSRQMRLLYSRSNRLVGMLHFQSFLLHITYNNVYRKIFGLCRRSSAIEMFVTKKIIYFEVLMGKSIFAFISRMSISNNNIICITLYFWVLREKFLKSGPDKLFLWA